MRKTFKDFVAEAASRIKEIYPWDLEEDLRAGQDILLLDVRCPSEFDRMRIEGSVNVPRGILETACDYGYEETEPVLVEARRRPIVVICRSGNRSVLAAWTLREMGFEDVASLKLGLRGWNDDEMPLWDAAGNRVSPDIAEKYFQPVLRPEQQGPAGAKIR
ncbi:MAG: rhodanese-like domain-containing protein [Magnetospirillum sp. WYHS-4]